MEKEYMYHAMYDDIAILTYMENGETVVYLEAEEREITFSDENRAFRFLWKRGYHF